METARALISNIGDINIMMDNLVLSTMTFWVYIYVYNIYDNSTRILLELSFINIGTFHVTYAIL